MCWTYLPENNIFQVSRINKKKAKILLEQDILKMIDIHLEFKISDKQRLQIEITRKGKPYIRKEEVKNFLAKIEYPVYYLDFETINPVIPPFKGTKPYQQILLQSLHMS